MAGKIAFVQAYELGFGQLDEMPLVFRIDLFLRPGSYVRCGVRPRNPRPDEVGDKLAELVAVAKPEGIWFPERLTDGDIAGG